MVWCTIKYYNLLTKYYTLGIHKYYACVMVNTFLTSFIFQENLFFSKLAFTKDILTQTIQRQTYHQMECLKPINWVRVRYIMTFSWNTLVVVIHCKHNLCAHESISISKMVNFNACFTNRTTYHKNHSLWYTL